MFFWAQDINETAEYCKANFADSVEETIKQADNICDNIFIFSDHWEMERTHKKVKFNGAVDWNHIPEDDPEWLYAMNRHTSFVNLGKAYTFTKDDKYAACFVRLIDDWISNVPLTKESSATTWRSLEAGLRCEFWLRALQLFKDSSIITKTLRNRIDNSLKEHGEYLVKTHNDFHRLSNWGVLQDHGLFLLGLYFDNEKWCSLALDRLEENLHLQVMHDGTHWEQSPMYHCEVLHCAIDVLTIADQNGLKISASYKEKVHDMCTALAKWLKPDGRLVCQSDSDDLDARDIIAQGALIFRDEYLKYIAGEELFIENLWDFGIDAVALYKTIEELPPKIASTALTDSGNYMLRGSSDANAGFLHFHCGCLGSGHGHGDLLHIDISANGEDVLIDSGRYTYVNTELRRKLKEPAAHNTTRVDDTDFSVCKDSWGYSKLALPVKGEYRFTETADYVSGGHLGYIDKGIFTQRKIVFIKPDIFIVFDQFFAEGQHAYTQNFHFAEGILTEDENAVYWKGKNTSASLHFLDDVKPVIYDAPYSKVYNLLEHGKAVLTEKTGSGFTSFITVISIGSKPAVVEKAAVSSLRFGHTFTDEKAQAVVITKDGKETTVIVCHSEVISEVDLLCANGKNGYGKVLVFTQDNPEGLCLAW